MVAHLDTVLTFRPLCPNEEVCFDARPHLFPLPQGEDIPGTISYIRLRRHQSSHAYFQGRGNNFSLSPGERAGVRASVTHTYFFATGSWKSQEQGQAAPPFAECI